MWTLLSRFVIEAVEKYLNRAPYPSYHRGTLAGQPGRSMAEHNTCTSASPITPTAATKASAHGQTREAEYGRGGAAAYGKTPRRLKPWPLRANGQLVRKRAIPR